MPRLRRSDCASPGIERGRRGRGFEYLDPHGERIEDEDTLRRIGELAIPPAWRDVWICLDPLGHLQATGLDAAGRKQYRYHDQWRAHRDRQKFDAMIFFAKALPGLRRAVARELRRPARSRRLRAEDLTRERVLACAVRLLDVGFFRIGSEDYAEQNGSFGLTTMLREHVAVQEHGLVFDFPAKSGQRRVQAISDPGARAVVAELKRRRTGDQLLAYREGRAWTDVHAEDVNEYIRDRAGDGFTAKDFRTWNATVLAAVALAHPDRSGGDVKPSARAVAGAIKSVADYLGNTPAIARGSYVDPRVIDRYQAGATIAPTLRGLSAAGPDLANGRVRARIERAVLRLLSDTARHRS